MLKDKVALVTGGSSGIGRATALLFSRQGAKVVVADINENEAHKTVRLIKDDSGEAIAVKTDVTKASEAEKMVKVAVQEYNKVDILFNNAGVCLIHSITDTTEEDWDRTIDINLKGVFLCSKYAIPEMKKQGGGSIINMGSEAGLRGHPDYSAYCASKGGVIALTKAMAVECAPYNIRVNCICPAAVETPMLEREITILGKGKPQEFRRSVGKSIPLGRIGEPEDIANAALFLASDKSSFVTGAPLYVDGGYLSGSVIGNGKD